MWPLCPIVPSLLLPNSSHFLWSSKVITLARSIPVGWKPESLHTWLARSQLVKSCSGIFFSQPSCQIIHSFYRHLFPSAILYIPFHCLAAAEMSIICSPPVSMKIVSNGSTVFPKYVTNHPDEALVGVSALFLQLLCKCRFHPFLCLSRFSTQKAGLSLVLACLLFW